MSLYIFDTETTGLTAPEIVEAAWIKIQKPRDTRQVDEFSCLYKPTKSIELGALATHHILDETLVTCEPSASFKLPEDCLYVAGHNIDFDVTAVGSPEVKLICTLALARKLWPKLDSHKQGALIYYLERERAQDLLQGTHRALNDCLVNLVILNHILANLPKVETWEQLWQASEAARIPEILTFGKHKGERYDKVPRQYLKWIIDKSDLDKYVKIAARRAL